MITEYLFFRKISLKFCPRYSVSLTARNYLAIGQITLQLFILLLNDAMNLWSRVNDSEWMYGTVTVTQNESMEWNPSFKHRF